MPLLNGPLPLLLPSASLLLLLLHSSQHKAHPSLHVGFPSFSLRLSCRCSRGCNLDQWCLPVSSTPQKTDAHLTSSLHFREIPFQLSLCLTYHQFTSKVSKERRVKVSFEKTKSSRRTGMQQKKQPPVKEVHTVLSVNEGGWRRGRGEREMDTLGARADRAYRCRLKQQSSMGYMWGRLTSLKWTSCACVIVHLWFRSIVAITFTDVLQTVCVFH